MSIVALPDLFGPDIRSGRFRAWLARPSDMPDVLALRAGVFRNGGDDRDGFDARTVHLCVGEEGGCLIATVRVAVHMTGASLLSGYAAQRYDLRAMAAQPGVTLELGRLCSLGNGDALRLIWAGVARLVHTSEARRFIGCTSFHTVDAEQLAPLLGHLAASHIGPVDCRPGVGSPTARPLEHFGVATDGAVEIPGLLKFYLSLGGWVSDHVVVDHDLGTCHIFTCVDIPSIPPARKRYFMRIGDIAASAGRAPLASAGQSG